MQTDVSASIAQEVVRQIKRRNKLSSSFKEISEDYQRVLHEFKEQAVRRDQNPNLFSIQ